MAPRVGQGLRNWDVTCSRVVVQGLRLTGMLHAQDARYGGWSDKRILAPPEHPYFSLEAFTSQLVPDLAAPCSPASRDAQWLLQDIPVGCELAFHACSSCSA
jgi:hypothetical protein